MQTSNRAAGKKLMQSLGWLTLSALTLILALVLFQNNPLSELLSQSTLGRKVQRSIRLDSLTSQIPWSKSADSQAPQEPDLTTAEAQALKDFPHLASSYRLTHKVLKTSEEWDEIRAIHSDRAAIADSANYLTQDEHMSEDFGLAHFRHLDYLKRVITLENNPAEEFAFEKVSTILNYRPKNWATLDEVKKQLVLGDKIDLIYVMQAYAPSVLEKMLAQSDNSSLNKLVQYAQENREFLQLVDL